MREKLAMLDGDGGPQASYTQEFHTRFKELFFDSVDIVQDPDISGDQLIAHCASLVPPGVQLSILGTQNIKGTGLDFVYRWVALDKVANLLAQLHSRNDEHRSQAIEQLDAFADHGLLDLALLRAELSKVRPHTQAQAARVAELQLKSQQCYAERKRALGKQSTQNNNSAAARAFGWLEGCFDFLDGARRYHQAKSLSRDLVAGRVSHARATLEMREIYARSKKGWLWRWWNQDPQ